MGNDAALKVKAKALTVNANNTKHVAAKIDAAIKHASSGRKKRAIASCAAFVVEVGYYNGNLTNNKQANVSSLVKVILAYVPKSHTCSAADVTGLNKAKKAVATISAALTSALAAVQAKLTVLTGTTASASAIASATTTATNSSSSNSS